MNAIRTFLAKIAAYGAVKRRGIGGLQAYGGVIRGQGYIEHKSGPLAGKTTHFEIEGQPASKT